MNKSITNEVWDKNCITYQNSLKHLSDDFNRGMLTFKEFEIRKKELRLEIFKGMKNPYMGD